ncbi:MXAN_6230/SCO0854 family RING domain-containing protein [Longispora sp. K20-0274]|uniref:MXAN_6230/SCO0854 family RING domain-containing protein n=1 Tax=Longispora sp. K20-0274 TaxID=3088255 RepID=UPI00399C19F5
MFGQVVADVDVADVLLRRFGLVDPSLLGTRVETAPGLRVDSPAAGLAALETDILSRGYLLGPGLYRHASGMDVERLTGFGQALLARLDAVVGADVAHLPLFRSFPLGIPADMGALYVDRVFALLLQEPEQPCVLCGEVDLVHAVAPCAHLACGRCWEAEAYTGCPICHARIDTDRPFLTPPAQDAPVGPAPRRAIVLELADQPGPLLDRALGRLLARRTPLSAAEFGDLDVLLGVLGTDDLGWLPAEIPVRTTRAAVLARLSRHPRFPELLAQHVDTATDLLRLLYVMQGGDPGLVRPPTRRHSPSHALRRAVLARLNDLPASDLVADLHRHRGAWIRLAEHLHPAERAHRHPLAAAAFAALRGSVLTPELAATAAAHPDAFTVTDGRLVGVRPNSRVEKAVRSGDTARATALLAGRPGDLLRRTVALAMRTDDPGTLLAAVHDAVPAVSPGVLIATLGAVRAATRPAGDRLYFPRGGTARLWTAPDTRPRLPAPLGDDLERAIVAELLHRAAALPAVDVALVDEGLADLVAPFAERTASDTLVALPRGSAQPLPDGDTIRLFLHWTEPAGVRVDLDLSVSFYYEGGEFAGQCDYTGLRFGDTAAVHSGDLTSAPAPLGASEFVDLDLRALRDAGVRYATMVVFSFNDVPFEDMTDAFAGLMIAPSAGHFDPRAVEQRFDLTGNARIATPIVLDLEDGELRWVDATLSSRGHGHAVSGYVNPLGQLSIAFDRYFGAGRRVSLWELACLHAAARAGTVRVRRRDGGVSDYRRSGGETIGEFAARLTGLGPTDTPGEASPPSFVAVVRGDVEVAAGGQAYALYPHALDATKLVTAADLLADLGPRPAGTA